MNTVVRILLVEDNPGDVDLIRELLTEAGAVNFRIESARRLSEALFRLKENNIELVLLDLGLPDSKGLDTYLKLKSAAPALPIIILTGDVDQDTAVTSVREGAQDFLIKGEITGTVIVRSIRYALERKGAEQELFHLNAELEQRVKERTEELEDANRELQRLNDELSIRKKEADAAMQQADIANKTKSEFLANMSHELRTPLNSIVGFSQVLLDGLYGPMNEKQEGYINNIYSSGNHLMSLINDILDLSKVESGKIDLDLSTVFLENLLHGTMSILKERAMKHGVIVTLDIGPDAAIEINTDERKLKQIMFNLLSNAVKFTPPGGSVRVAARRVRSPEFGVRSGEKDRSAEIGTGSGKNSSASGVRNSEQQKTYSELRTQNFELDRDFIEISVADTGIGIKPGDMDKLFKPFSQVESVYTKTYEGTGLGLALSKRLVEFLGGRIWVGSEFEKGSIFSFVIPVNTEQKQKGA